MSLNTTVDRIAALAHQTFTSPWVTVDQQRINAFADATDDRQWIHVDEELARQASPYGTTIAHGFLSLSLYPWIRSQMPSTSLPFEGAASVVNYGLERLRFPHPVPAGSRVRGHSQLLSAEPKGEKALLVRESFTLELEGADKPALVAEILWRLNFPA